MQESQRWSPAAEDGGWGEKEEEERLTDLRLSLPEAVSEAAQGSAASLPLLVPPLAKRPSPQEAPQQSQQKVPPQHDGQGGRGPVQGQQKVLAQQMLS